MKNIFNINDNPECEFHIIFGIDYEDSDVINNISKETSTEPNGACKVTVYGVIETMKPGVYEVVFHAKQEDSSLDPPKILGCNLIVEG